MRLYEFDDYFDDDFPMGEVDDDSHDGLSPETLILCQQIAATLKKDCKPFLAATNNFKFGLFRGINDFKGLPLLSKHRCPKNRKPMDSLNAIHKITDNWFKQKTGIAFRSNSVFCTGNPSTASEYGNVFMMMPIGNFDFCYSRMIEDWYSLCEDQYNYRDLKDDRAEFTRRIIGDLENGQYEFNTSIRGFQNGISSEHEMMIHCRDYYLLRHDDDASNGGDTDALVLAEIRKYL